MTWAWWRKWPIAPSSCIAAARSSRGIQQDLCPPAQAYTRALLTSVPVLGSMRGEPAPLHFPVVDLQTGIAGPALPLSGTPGRDAPLLDVRGLVTRFDVRGELFNRRVARVSVRLKTCPSASSPARRCRWWGNRATASPPPENPSSG